MPMKPPAPLDPAAAHQRYLAQLRETIDTLSGPAGTFLLLAMAATIVLLPVAWPAWRGRRRARALLPALREVAAFAHRAAPTIAYPLMVNSALRQPGDDPAPGLVLISTDPAAANDLAYMAGLAVSVGSGGVEGDTARWSDADHAFALTLMADEEFQPFRRRRLPASITGGPSVYACDLVILPQLLAGGHVRDDAPFLPVLAEPGDQGRLTLLPHWMLADARPTEDEEAALFVFIALFHEFTETARKTAPQSPPPLP